MKGKILLTAILASTCVSAFAYETKVSYSSFHCEVQKSTIDSLKQAINKPTVKMDTKNILLLGAAAGQPNVSTAGHIENLSLDVFEKYYFETEPDNGKNGDVTITVSNVDDSTFQLNCSEGHGDGLALYGEGTSPAL